MKRAQCINEVYEIAGMTATHGVIKMQELHGCRNMADSGVPRVNFFNVDTGFDYEERFPFPWADLDHPSHSVATSMAKNKLD